MVVDVLLMKTCEISKCNEGDQGISAGSECIQRKLQSNQLYCKLFKEYVTKRWCMSYLKKKN